MSGAVLVTAHRVSGDRRRPKETFGATICQRGLGPYDSVYEIMIHILKRHPVPECVHVLGILKRVPTRDDGGRLYRV